MSRHLNIPIFIPHLGCPHTCVFCNQRSISGHASFDPESVAEQIVEALSTTGPEDEAEIAYFGGSFTGIDRGLMLRLLELAEHFVQNPIAGRAHVAGIRLSTRPDYISDEIVQILSEYTVSAVELGLQSMDDGVLAASGRGHDASCAERACRLLTDAGFSVVGQIMIGLPGSTPDNELQTARRMCVLGIRAARIYPTVVFADTALCDMMQAGTYLPLTLEQAVSRSAKVLCVLEQSGVRVIRIGLCASDNLTDPACAVAGANHPAMGELVRSRLYYEKLRELLLGAKAPVQTVYIPARELSLAIGQHRQNLQLLQSEFGADLRLVAYGGAEPQLLVKETGHCT